MITKQISKETGWHALQPHGAYLLHWLLFLHWQWEKNTFRPPPSPTLFYFPSLKQAWEHHAKDTVDTGFSMSMP